MLTRNELHNFFREYFLYYRTLDESWQKIFIRRVQRFVQTKAIYGAEGFVVNDKVMAIVAASAVQLSLGLETWDYDYFNEIIIHPGAFAGEAGKQLQKGETNLRGFVRLSWPGFIQGYKNPNDNLNLGIHEFAHALRFNGIRGNEEDYFLRHFFVLWMASAYEAHLHLKEGKDSIFRSYGGANINEFISVCMEHYFESPDQIKDAYPLLYYNTAILLNQHTHKGKTSLNIREKMLEEKNRLLLPLTEKQFKGSPFKSEMFPIILLVLILYGITVFTSGFASGPSFALMSLGILFFLRLDYNLAHIIIKQKQLEIKKGRWLFKRKPGKISLSQLISVSFSKKNKWADLVFLYYNVQDKHFYEESLEANLSDANVLLDELRLNKIPVKQI